MASGRPVGALEKVEALFANPALYELAELVPEPDRSCGGRPRHYPKFMVLAFDALLSVFGSARQVEAELAHPLVWGLIRDTAARHRPEERLPDRPMRKHHHRYLRDRYLTDPAIFASLADRHRQLAIDQARSLGLLDPHGGGSYTHPEPSRMLYADGKVITPLFKAQGDEPKLDKATGELRIPRHESDGHLHFQGDGETAFGVKFVLVAVRSPHHRGRIIVDAEWVPTAGGEAATAMDCFTRLAPLAPGAQGVIYDTALRGTHHQRLMRDLGLLPVNRVTAAKAGAKRPRRKDGQREKKSVHLEDKTITAPDGTRHHLRLYARGGDLGIGDLTDTGDITFTELRRMRTHRNADKNGRYRWYNDYRLPDRHGGGTLTVRLHGNDQDRARKLNRTENLRPIPPGDPDFARLYPRRNDAESINRDLDDTLYLRRAHSLGAARQHLNLLGYALVINAIAVHRYTRRRAPDARAA
ncbi:hypothetical protein [Rhabdothermincola salaria]|uniref:hypothetical protein n=1 Tax=Rhabdothermincola salaria TaxID=2903142 RepID=UPI001E5F667B|nr:hypothetical protein [Rhabdothermincola salaria]MCD9625302.1 hypothetical protein [Rhabdothermincola salaria]